VFITVAHTGAALIAAARADAAHCRLRRRRRNTLTAQRSPAQHRLRRIRLRCRVSLLGDVVLGKAIPITLDRATSELVVRIINEEGRRLQE